MVSALHLGTLGMTGVQENIVVDRRILIVVQCLIDRFFRQVNHRPAKPTKHPCRQAILGFAHAFEMSGAWSGLQGEDSIKLIYWPINKWGRSHAKSETE